MTHLCPILHQFLSAFPLRGFNREKKGIVMAKAKSNNMIGLIAAVGLFLLILFLLPGKVGARDLCNGRGYRNATDGLCNCISGYHGEGCEYSKCLLRIAVLVFDFSHFATTFLQLQSTARSGSLGSPSH
jgi:hypothetical protein